jgi:hypothetical protein
MNARKFALLCGVSHRALMALERAANDREA